MMKKVYESGEKLCVYMAEDEYCIRSLESRYHVTIEREEEDPYASLKAAHAAGKVIEEKTFGGGWRYCPNPTWHPHCQAFYRVKPELERCEITTGSEMYNGDLVYHSRHGENAIDLAVRDPDFAGFEFDGGLIEPQPWRRVHVGRTATNDLEHATHVLFRRR